ncbi:MAG: ribonuclease J [Clostridiales bacterium]|nr:ribonuclease J [Clostridiales bacterium]
MSESNKTRTRRSRKLKVIPLGGLHEIGKNLTLLEYGNDILIIDCGMAFPDDEMLGIDVVIPDFSYLIENSDRIRGLVITHPHEDHIGAVPYLLKSINVPIYGTRLTIGFIKNKLKEHQINNADLNVIKPGDTVKLGVFKVEAIHMTHSVADSLAFCVQTPLGYIFHTGDFKVDFTPVDGDPIDFARLATIGDRGLLLLMSDSTNAVRKGYTASEKVVGLTLNNIFANTKKRIIIATFSSNVHRVQRIVDTAVANDRKVAVSGRSMENMVALAKDLGYLNIPAGTLVDIQKIKNIKDSELVIITTGSQGEPMSALTRMANNMHKQVSIRPGDMVILSSTAVPGNEKMVSNVVNALMEKGAEVIYNDIADTHVSGHAAAEELKLILTLLKPKFFMPVHGEMRHLYAHAELATEMGMEAHNILKAKNGEIFEFTKNTAVKLKETLPAGGVMVDGLGIGDVGSSVLSERKYLSEAGLIVIAASFEEGHLASRPEIVSRGFVYAKQQGDILEELRQIAEDVIVQCIRSGVRDVDAIAEQCRARLRNHIYRTMKRSPVIIPVFMEI